MVGASPDAFRLGRILYAVLLANRGQSFQHRSSHSKRSRSGGLEAFFHTQNTLDPLEHVWEIWYVMWVCPSEHWWADVNAGKDFLASLIEWEIKVAACEVASGDKISEAVRVATIMDHAPDAVKSIVDALKLWIGESSYATLGLFQGSMPMQIGTASTIARLWLTLPDVETQTAGLSNSAATG